jgi:hypothetical protein
MDRERTEVPERAHDQPAEGGREQAEEALEQDETEPRPETPGSRTDPGGTTDRR